MSADDLDFYYFRNRARSQRRSCVSVAKQVMARILCFVDYHQTDRRYSAY